MVRFPTLGRKLSATIPFARGVADRAVSTAGPVVLGVVGRVTAHLPRRSRTEPSHPETFTPSPVADAPQVEEHGKADGPSPATVARNAAGPRPTAKPPAQPKPRSVPGAKLPVTRPST